MITDDVQLCIDALTKGELVAFPTETVFGLGARADSPAAVQKIFDIKGRPTDHPLILHCSDVDIALAISPYVPEYARALASEFWPGPMTLIFKRAASDAICDEAVGGHDTVAIRVPSHPKARALLAPCGFFVAAPSANRFGHVSPTTVEHVRDEFGDDLLILDGDQSGVGLESTIISCVQDQPAILRAGAITVQDILRVTGIEPVESPQGDGNVKIAAPGTLENHYSPDIPLFVVASEAEVEKNSQFSPGECAFMSLSQPVKDYRVSVLVNNYDQYAHELYDFMRRAEIEKCQAIFVVAPENEGIGIAINDRLKRASSSSVNARL